MSKIEPKFDHSKAGWKRTNNFIPNMSDRPAKPGQRCDREGLTADQRRRIEDIKDEQTYSREDDTREVWEE